MGSWGSEWGSGCWDQSIHAATPRSMHTTSTEHHKASHGYQGKQSKQGKHARGNTAVAAATSSGAGRHLPSSWLDTPCMWPSSSPSHKQSAHCPKRFSQPTLLLSAYLGWSPQGAGTDPGLPPPTKHTTWAPSQRMHATSWSPGTPHSRVEADFAVKKDGGRLGDERAGTR